MVVILDVSDLTPFADIDPAKADAMVTHVLALASRVAPCLTTTTDQSVIAAAKAMLVGVVLRWHESGVSSYSVYSNQPGGFPADPRRERRNMLWPSEIEDLQQLCVTGAASSSVYTVTLAP